MIHKEQFEPVFPKVTEALNDVGKLLICGMSEDTNVRQTAYLQNCQEALQEALVALTNARSYGT